MVDNKSKVDEIVTKFFLNTCRLSRQLTEHAAEAAIHCAGMTTVHPQDDEVDFIPLTTGSVAEFYIEPMLPLVGDIDVMFHCNTLLAIPREHPPPTQLPDEFHNYVKVYEIIDSHLPGYVYLELRYLLTECIDDDKYNAVEYDRQMYLTNRLFHRGNRCVQLHGPAFCAADIGSWSLDCVGCVRCLSWPSQAADWPTRHRNYGWPDSATVDRVVNNGSDVVPVAHRQCRQHEWMSKHQWRLSFSRAEIVLINSWMPAQQIVYHMLRVLVKTERLTDSADNSGASTLSNYHIKTLMLWACELKPRRWWTDDLNLCSICFQLLNNLADWLHAARCRHYFISNCNLIGSSFDLATIVCRLMSVHEASLSTWFVNNYIRKCSQLCPETVSRLFDDVSTSGRLQNAASAIVEWRMKSTFFDMLHVYGFTELCIQSMLSDFPLTVRSLKVLMSEVAKMSSTLVLYVTGVVCLHVARNGFSDESMDVLATILGQFVDARRYFYQSSSVLSLNTAAKLMKVEANKPLSTVQLIEIELSKAYLYRALRCSDSDSDSIYCLANVYLAALYYTRGQYQTAIDHCTLVTRSQDHSQCSSHVVQGELLPKIDDDIDNMLGLAALYQFLRRAALNQQHQQRQYVSAFTTELLARYLHIRCLSVIKCGQVTDTSSNDQVERYVNYITDTHQLCIADVLLFKSVCGISEHKFLHTRGHRRREYVRNCPTELNTSELVELLQQSAVEHLTSYRHLVARDFGSVATIVTTDFEALYAYKRGDYQQCLQLSTQNVHTLLYARRYMVYMSTFPEFIQLLDDDIVCLTALTLIVNPKCRGFGCYVVISQLTLSLYLMTQCQLKLRHSVTSLAQTLDYIEVAQRRSQVNYTLDRLTMKLIEHKIVRHLVSVSRGEYGASWDRLSHTK